MTSVLPRSQVADRAVDASDPTVDDAEVHATTVGDTAISATAIRDTPISDVHSRPAEPADAEAADAEAVGLDAVEKAVPAKAAPKLSERQRTMIVFERQWWRQAGSKEQAIREQFGLSATRYYQMLNQLLDRPEALAFDPLVVGRLRRLRATRARTRMAH